jgi:hypothetical protein
MLLHKSDISDNLALLISLDISTAEEILTNPEEYHFPHFYVRQWSTALDGMRTPQDGKVQIGYFYREVCLYTECLSYKDGVVVERQDLGNPNIKLVAELAAAFREIEHHARWFILWSKRISTERTVSVRRGNNGDPEWRPLGEPNKKITLTVEQQLVLEETKDYLVLRAECEQSHWFLRLSRLSESEVSVDVLTHQENQELMNEDRLGF